MSSVECLRGFINERLTAAAEEIFGVFQKTIVEYEDEIDRQRKLLYIFLKPEIKLHRIELPQQHVCKEEEVLADQLLCNQERNSSVDQEDPEPPQIKEEQGEVCCSQEGEQLVLKERNSSLDQEDPEPPQIKEEQEEVCSSQEGEQLVLKQETDTSMLNTPHEESDHSEPEPKSDHQLRSHNSHVTESQDQEGGKLRDSGSSRAAEPKPKKRRNAQKGHKPIKCDTCGSVFKYKSQFLMHQRVHTGEKPFACNTCGKSFRLRKALNTHIRVHTGEKPFSCKTCGRNFRSSGKLWEHMKVHTGEKPYSCNTCGKLFARSNQLVVHMIKHTGKKPYLCKTCHRGFSNLAQLKNHIPIHEG